MDFFLLIFGWRLEISLDFYILLRLFSLNFQWLMGACFCPFQFEQKFGLRSCSSRTHLQHLNQTKVSCELLHSDSVSAAVLHSKDERTRR